MIAVRDPINVSLSYLMTMLSDDYDLGRCGRTVSATKWARTALQGILRDGRLQFHLFASATRVKYNSL